VAAAGPLVIVGASLAGLRAAQAARSAGHEGEIVLLGEERHLPYTRPPLSKEVLHKAADLESTAFPNTDTLEVTWRLGERATGVDLEQRTLALAGGEPLAFGRLIIATGCRARPWTGPGAGLAGLHTLRHRDDAVALGDALERGPHRLAILGAGFIGCEVAASARKLGIEVTLIDIAPLPMPALGELLGARCAELHRSHGVDLRLGTGVAALRGDADGHVAAVELADGSRVDADVVLVALGAIPNTEWLDGSGLTLEPGVLCDDTLAALGAQDVFCAGDVATWPHPLAGGAHVRVEHWTNAAEQGTLVGRNAVVAPEERRAYTAVPSFWSDQYDVKIQVVGLPRQAQEVRVVEAAPEGDRFVAVGVRDGHVVAGLAFNGARRLPWYRRQIGEGATLDAVLDAVAEDPKSFGTPEAIAT
jgi:3-phenylpropionate/trans-cinnamate dioxygenase ferredoxin reductase component